MLPRRGDRGPIAIECKWKADTFEPRAIEAFRRLHPGGPNYVVSTDADTPYTRSRGWARGRAHIAGAADRSAVGRAARVDAQARAGWQRMRRVALLALAAVTLVAASPEN